MKSTAIVPGHMSEDRSAFRLPFRYWRDRDTQQFEAKQPEMANPIDCHRLLLWKEPVSGQSYLLNNKNREYMLRQGPFRPPYYPAEDLFGRYAGHDAFVFCPGPSMAQVDLSAFDDRLTIAVNSAGFKIDPTFWAVFESNFMIEVLQGRAPPPDRTFLMTARCASRWRGWGFTPKAAAYYVARFEEEWILPHRMPAIGTMGALVTAWWLGARRIFIVGLDLSRPKGQPYIKGVPFGKTGATNPFDEQFLVFDQWAYPGVEVFNGSPHESRERLAKVFTPISYGEIEEIALSAPAIGGVS